MWIGNLFYRVKFLFGNFDDLDRSKTDTQSQSKWITKPIVVAMKDYQGKLGDVVLDPECVELCQFIDEGFELGTHRLQPAEVHADGNCFLYAEQTNGVKKTVLEMREEVAEFMRSNYELTRTFVQLSGAGLTLEVEDFVVEKNINEAATNYEFVDPVFYFSFSLLYKRDLIVLSPISLGTCRVLDRLSTVELARDFLEGSDSWPVDFVYWTHFRHPFDTEGGNHFMPHNVVRPTLNV